MQKAASLRRSTANTGVGVPLLSPPDLQIALHMASICLSERLANISMSVRVCSMYKALAPGSGKPRTSSYYPFFSTGGTHLRSDSGLNFLGRSFRIGERKNRRCSDMAVWGYALTAACATTVSSTIASVFFLGYFPWAEGYP